MGATLVRDGGAMLPDPVTDDHPVSRAREIVERGFQFHSAVYVLVNLMLVGIWAAAGFGYFWPVWPMLGWGLAVAIHGYAVYGHSRY